MLERKIKRIMKNLHFSCDICALNITHHVHDIRIWLSGSFLLSVRLFLCKSASSNQPCRVNLSNRMTCIHNHYPKSLIHTLLHKLFYAWSVTYIIYPDDSQSAEHSCGHLFESQTNLHFYYAYTMMRMEASYLSFILKYVFIVDTFGVEEVFIVCNHKMTALLFHPCSLHCYYSTNCCIFFSHCYCPLPLP